KIPNEFTVVEWERLLELREEQEAIEKEDVVDSKEQIARLYQTIYNQIEVLFKHYQPDITIEYLKKIITNNEALEMLGFFQKYKHIAIKERKKETQREEAKKKLS